MRHLPHRLERIHANWRISPCSSRPSGGNFSTNERRWIGRCLERRLLEHHSSVPRGVPAVTLSVPLVDVIIHIVERVTWRVPDAECDVFQNLLIDLIIRAFFFRLFYLRLSAECPCQVPGETSAYLATCLGQNSCCSKTLSQRSTAIRRRQQNKNDPKINPKRSSMFQNCSSKPAIIIDGPVFHDVPWLGFPELVTRVARNGPSTWALNANGGRRPLAFCEQPDADTAALPNS